MKIFNLEKILVAVNVVLARYCYCKKISTIHLQEIFWLKYQKLSEYNRQNKNHIQTIHNTLFTLKNIFSCSLGFSDPYCMLGIQPGNPGAPLSPQTNLTAHSPHTPPASPRQAIRALSDGVDIENSHHEKLRKHHR